MMYGYDFLKSQIFSCWWKIIMTNGHVTHGRPWRADHSIMLNVTWRRFDQSAKQLIVGHTTIHFFLVSPCRPTRIMNALCIGPLYLWMNEWIFNSSTQIQYSKNSKERNCVDWTERLKEHLQVTTVLKDTLMKKQTALKLNISLTPKSQTFASDKSLVWDLINTQNVA